MIKLLRPIIIGDQVTDIASGIGDLFKEMRDFTKEETNNYQESLEKIYKPTGVNIFDLDDKVDFDGKELSPCDNCPNNIKNGGSGICHCTLGTPVIY